MWYILNNLSTVGSGSEIPFRRAFPLVCMTQHSREPSYDQIRGLTDDPKSRNLRFHGASKRQQGGMIWRREVW